ncbi:MAG: dependent epimerase/dehydratase family [Myxococcales bacterium]|nr:dependent epimerase/dehydratase family [Myxococcales bacterium]
MIIGRRRFVVGSLAAAAAAACSSHEKRSTAMSETTPKPAPAPPVKKSILVLGGTGFLGPHVVKAAVARGHTLTLFNRGKTHPGLFPDIEKLQGDRDGKLDALKGRTWDAVVDPSGYVPRIVKLSAELLAPNVGQYVFISTISVYKDPFPIGGDESAPVQTLDDPTNEDVGKNYGALKALSEKAAETAMPGKVTNVRSGLIIGPGDPTGRFTHWPSRMADGGEVIGPGDGTTPAQYIDGRDLGEWIIHAIENQTFGTYNALGPGKPITMKAVLDRCNEAAGNKAKITWVDGKFLTAHEVSGWSDMPMWIDNTGEDAGFGTMANARGVAAGMKFRPVLETARDTLAWLETLPADERAKVRSTGIKPDKEAKVLAAWHAAKH